MLFPSSSPKGAPWTLQVPAFFEPKPITVLKITTKYQSKSSKIKKYYYPIIDWQKSGLKEKSYIDTIKKVNLLKSDVSFHYVGRLSSQDKNGLRKFIDELG